VFTCMSVYVCLCVFLYVCVRTSAAAGGEGGADGDGDADGDVVLHLLQSHVPMSCRTAPPAAILEPSSADPSLRAGAKSAREIVGVLPIASRLLRRAPTSLQKHAHEPLLPLFAMMILVLYEPGPTGC